MATRLTLPSITLPDARSAAGRLATWRPELGSDRRTTVWQFATAPWWLWSDMPKLPLPARNPSLPAGGLAGDWVVKGIDRIAVRVWIQRSLAIVARGLWLALLVGCLWLLIELLGGPALDTRGLLGVGIFFFICSVIVAALSRPSRAQIARMLDRSFGLQERISTALGNVGIDIPAEGERAAVTYLQMADAANAVTVTREHPAFRLRLPARELVMGVALGLAFAALAFARGAGGGVPEVQTNVVPAFVPAAQRFVQPKPEPAPPDPQNVPSVAEAQKMVQDSLDNQQDLSTLADALSDHAVTRDAAQLIDQGKYNEAAEALRDVSTHSDQLSDSDRQDLANDLNQAASQMSEGNKTLSGATQQAADGLEQGGESANEGVRDLANAVEQSGQQVQSSSELDQAMQQARQYAAEHPQSQQSQPESSDAPGNPGEQSPSQDTSNPGQSPSSASGQQTGQPGKADAEGGQGSEESDGQDPSQSSSEPGQGAPAQSDSSGQSSQRDGQSESQGQQSQPGNSSGDSSQQSSEPADSDAANPSQGGGVGGPSANQDQQHATDANSPAEQAGAASETKKDPSKSNVTDASKTGDDTSGPNSDTHAAVTLERQPDGQSVQINTDSNSSRVGPGAGVTVSSGSATQGDVGEAGPDSNHVPPEYRSIVESYFSDKEDGS